MNVIRYSLLVCWCGIASRTNQSPSEWDKSVIDLKMLLWVKKRHALYLTRKRTGNDHKCIAISLQMSIWIGYDSFIWSHSHAIVIFDCNWLQRHWHQNRKRWMLGEPLRILSDTDWHGKQIHNFKPLNGTERRPSLPLAKTRIHKAGQFCSNQPQFTSNKIHR